MTGPLFVLASSSAERKRLLESVGLPPDLVISPDVDETRLADETPRQYVQRVSQAKALAGAQTIKENALVLAADTVAIMGQRVFGKPVDAAQARAFFKLFSGRTHRIYTSISLATVTPTGVNPKVITKVIESKITFTRMTSEQIENLVSYKEWERCSGGYSIRGYASAYIKTISGSLSGILGLPIFEVMQLLRGQPGLRGQKRMPPQSSPLSGQDLHWPI